MTPGSWPEPKKEYSADQLNFDDPEAPDYISASPAFQAYYDRKRSERISQELWHKTKLILEDKKSEPEETDPHKYVDVPFYGTEKEFDKKWRKIFWKGCGIVFFGILFSSWILLWVLPRIYGY